MDSPGLVNGFYNVWIEGSLATSYPDLVSLFGLDQYDDGSAKYMGVSLRNSSNRPVPIQTVRSKIADLAGPDVPVPIGGAATFTWETQGYGEQFCYVDGQKVANTADLVSGIGLGQICGQPAVLLASYCLVVSQPCCLLYITSLLAKQPCQRTRPCCLPSVTATTVTL